MAKVQKAMRMALKGAKLMVTKGPRVTWQLVKEKKTQKQAYQQMATLHLISPEERVRQKQAQFKNPVVISVLTPLYNTPERFLTELIDSLQAQTYPNWELCLADASDDEHGYVGQICRERAEKDPRIVYRHLEKNGGISRNTNACIQLASGAYFGLLDHDDVLHESALYEVMKAIDEQGADFIYTDEVKFDGDPAKANDFNFKPDFGKDELRVHNYICHFTCYSRALLETLEEAYRPAFDGSQDHDIVLRLTERAKCIVHIPKVLYYWRLHGNSVSLNLGSKSYAVDAAIRAVKEQLERAGEPGTVESNLPYLTNYRIRYEMGTPRVSVLLYDAETKAQAQRCLEGLCAHTAYRPLEILCYDQAAPQCDQEEITIKTIARQKTLGESLDAMAQAATGEMLALYSAFLTPEEPDWIYEMAMFAQRADICAVGGKCYDEKDNVLCAGVALDKDEEEKLKALCRGTHRDQQGFEAMLRYVRNVTAVHQECMMIRRQTWQALGGFACAPAGYEAVDLCLRGEEKGLSNVWTPYSAHKRNGHGKQADKHTQEFAEKWSERLAHDDAYYNPNLKKLGLV